MQTQLMCDKEYDVEMLYGRFETIRLKTKIKTPKNVPMYDWTIFFINVAYQFNRMGSKPPNEQYTFKKKTAVAQHSHMCRVYNVHIGSNTEKKLSYQRNDWELKARQLNIPLLKS